jgi:hypothetical protein
MLGKYDENHCIDSNLAESYCAFFSVEMTGMDAKFGGDNAVIRSWNDGVKAEI